MIASLKNYFYSWCHKLQCTHANSDSMLTKSIWTFLGLRCPISAFLSCYSHQPLKFSSWSQLLSCIGSCQGRYFLQIAKAWKFFQHYSHQLRRSCIMHQICKAQSFLGFSQLDFKCGSFTPQRTLDCIFASDISSCSDHPSDCEIQIFKAIIEAKWLM